GRPAAAAGPGAGPAPRGAAADVRPARRRRAKLSGGGRRARDLAGHGHEPPLLRPPEAAGAPGRADLMGYEYDPADPAPPPWWLAAYVDDELGPAECLRLEAWLDTHPEAAAEVEAMRRLDRAWEETAAPRPSPDVWERVRADIEAATAARPRRWFSRA